MINFYAILAILVIIAIVFSDSTQSSGVYKITSSSDKTVTTCSE